MSRVDITFDDLDLSILQEFIRLHRVNRSMEDLLLKQTAFIISLAAEIDQLKRRLGLPKTEKDDDTLARCKELAIRKVDHLMWTRGYQAYTDPYTGEVDQDWKPPEEGGPKEPEKLTRQNPKIIDMLLYQTRQRRRQDED